MNTSVIETPLSAPHAAAAKHAGHVSARLNSNCFCISLDGNAMRQALASELGSPALLELLQERCPYLFSAQPVFVSDRQTERMAAVVRAVETVVALPAYRQHILAHAPAIASHDPGGAKGVFFGYDFHLSDDGIGLIEINTNAGGAMLNAVIARAHRACCLDSERLAMAETAATALEQNIVDMFLNEWRLAKRERPLRTIAIVDAEPQQQYLYPEFLLFQSLFERHGLHAVIADPAELTLQNGLLWHGDTCIDMVYNRLTDFMLEAPASAALRAAYQEHAVVLTPHPQAHALYADKRNLSLFCNDPWLKSMGVPPQVRDTLVAAIPRTEVVDPANAERLWSQRRHFFFKPTAGYGGRAAYRGDKITTRVWQEILAGDYVAQAIMAPGERAIGSRDQPELLKFDVRSYAYDGVVQWTAARIYQGQTTNFRTPGGGFAPVYSLADAELKCEIGDMERTSPASTTMCGKSCA